MKPWKFNRGIATSILVCLLLFNLNTFSYGERHWAQAEMEYLLSKGIVSGYPDGTLKPDNPITRAEFVRIINNVIGSSKVANVSFKDVKKTDWFYTDVAKAVKVGYVQGYGDNTFRPNNLITREEAAKIIVAAFGLEHEDFNKDSSFTDNHKISNWAKEYVYILKNKKYIAGYPDGTFRPKNPITRAEAMKMITNISGEIINAKGEYSLNVNKNILVNTLGVELKDTRIRGDLYLTVGIGNGDVILNNVKVNGNVYVTGGGTESVRIKDSNINKIVINNKLDNRVNVVLDNSKVSLIYVRENAKFTAKKGSIIETIIVTGESKITIEKDAKVDRVQVDADGVEITVNGTIETLIANADFILNGQKISKGTQLSLKDGKILDSKKDHKYKDRKDDRKGDRDDHKVNYRLIVELDKNEYDIDEIITLSGRVLKNNVGLKDIDITLKLGDIPITVEQVKTDENGQFTVKFTVPETTKEGQYKLIVKANEPVNLYKELNIKLLRKGEKYKFNVDLSKEKYTLNELITVRGQVLEENIGLSNIDITIQLKDYNGKEVITVEQLKTDAKGDFECSFKVPEVTEIGKYYLILKANEPLNNSQQFTIEIIDG